MTRDFTEEAKQKLIQQINEVTETTTWGKVGDFFGDIWLSVQKWTGQLSVQKYLDDVDAYHQKILDQRNTKVSQINRIFKNIEAVDAESAAAFVSCDEEISAQLTELKKLVDVLGIPKSNFTVVNINDCFSGKKTPAQLQVEVNADYNVPKQQWLEITPRKTNREGHRSAAAYNEVMEEFDVENNARYRPGNGSTWCNIYVWDVTKAMGCEIPHYYNKYTGEPMTRAEALANKNSYYEMSANRMTTWLENHGESYGWIECDEKTAISMANKGYPTVTAGTTTGHVAMVAPQRAGESGVMISQAGGSNFEHGSIKSGFGKYSSNVKYFYHV